MNEDSRAGVLFHAHHVVCRLRLSAVFVSMTIGFWDRGAAQSNGAARTTSGCARTVLPVPSLTVLCALMPSLAAPVHLETKPEGEDAMAHD